MFASLCIATTLLGPAGNETNMNKINRRLDLMGAVAAEPIPRLAVTKTHPGN